MGKVLRGNRNVKKEELILYSNILRVKLEVVIL